MVLSLYVLLVEKIDY